MKLLKKVWPYLLVAVIAVIAYFMFAKDKIQKALAKTSLTAAQQKLIYDIAKQSYATVLETDEDVSVVISFPNKTAAAKYDKALKLAGFTNDPDEPLKYKAVLKKS